MLLVWWAGWPGFESQHTLFANYIFFLLFLYKLILTTKISNFWKATFDENLKLSLCKLNCSTTHGLKPKWVFKANHKLSNMHLDWNKGTSRQIPLQTYVNNITTTFKQLIIQQKARIKQAYSCWYTSTATVVQRVIKRAK